MLFQLLIVNLDGEIGYKSFSDLHSVIMLDTLNFDMFIFIGSNGGSKILSSGL